MSYFDFLYKVNQDLVNLEDIEKFQCLLVGEVLNLVSKFIAISGLVQFGR